MVIIEMQKPILTQEQKNEEIKKSIRQKAIERGKLEKEAKKQNIIQSQLQTKQYNNNNYINNNYTHIYQNLCPNCQRKKYQKRRQQYKQYVDSNPYYQYQEQYQEQPYYEDNYENEDSQNEQNEYQYEYQEEDNNIYEQPKYESRTFQPYVYSLEERNQLLQNARPMFTVLSYGNTDSDIYGTSAYNTYNTYTEPVQKSTTTKKQMIKDNNNKNNKNINQQQTQQKNQIKQEIKKEEIKKEENKSNVNINIENDIKKTTNAKEVKKVETEIEKKEEKKEEKKVERRDRIGDIIRGQKQQVSSKKYESTCSYKKRGGFGIAKKIEKIRQSSTNKNDKRKKHHLTYEVINIEVEKKE